MWIIRFVCQYHNLAAFVVIPHEETSNVLGVIDTTPQFILLASIIDTNLQNGSQTEFSGLNP